MKSPRTYSQTTRQTYRQTDRHADRQTSRQTEIFFACFVFSDIQNMNLRQKESFFFHSCDYNTFSFYIRRMWWESKKNQQGSTYVITTYVYHRRKSSSSEKASKYVLRMEDYHPACGEFLRDSHYIGTWQCAKSRRLLSLNVRGDWEFTMSFLVFEQSRVLWWWWWWSNWRTIRQIFVFEKQALTPKQIYSTQLHRTFIIHTLKKKTNIFSKYLHSLLTKYKIRIAETSYL